MKHPFGSFYTVWRNERGFEGVESAGGAAASATGWRSWYLTLVAFLIASLCLLLTPRTDLGVGLAPHVAYRTPLLLLALLCIAVPVAPWRGGGSPIALRTGHALLLAFALVGVGVLPLLLRFLPGAGGVPLSVALGAGAVYSALWLGFLGRCLRGSGPIGAVAPALRRIGRQTLVLCGAYLLCLAVGNIHQYILCRADPWGAPLGYPAAALLRLLGVDAAVTGASPVRISLFHADNAVPVLVSADKVGGDFLLYFFVALGALAWAYGVSMTRVAFAMMVGGAYALLRFVALVGAAATTGSTLPWWGENTLLLTFFPLLPLVRAVLTPSGAGDVPRKRAAFAASSVSVASVILIALGTTLAGGGLLWSEGGERKAGTVLIDERYSRWEWSEAPLDTQLYGVKTVYSYYNMMETVGHYYPVRRNFADITDATLEGVSVLILKTPTEPYPIEVLDTIERFVVRGGGVWLIGDHTNVFGMNTYLNSVAGRYGLAFVADAVVDPDTNRELYAPTALAHPITRQMPVMLWYTGCSLRVPWFGTQDVIAMPRLLADNPDLSVNTFFGDFAAQLDERIGPIVQAAAVEHGRGRIALWSDSTLFSNFAIFFPGKMELALGYIEWLNRRNTALPLRPWLLGGGAGLVLLGLVLWGPLSARGSRAASALFQPRFAATEAVIAACWLGVALVPPAFSIAQSRLYPPLVPNRPFERIAFLEPGRDTEHFPVAFPLPDDVTTHNYLTAFIAAQRIGKRPFVARTVAEATEAPVVVLVHSHQGLTADDRIALQRFVQDGGRLVVLDGGSGHRGQLEGLLGRLGVRLRDVPLREVPLPIHDRHGEAINKTHNGHSAEEPPAAPPTQEQLSFHLLDTRSRAAHFPLGPQPVLLGMQGVEPLVQISSETESAPPSLIRANDASGSVVVGTVRSGKGQVIVSTTQALFSDASLGDNSDVPDARRLVLLQMLFAWFGEEQSSAAQAERSPTH